MTNTNIPNLTREEFAKVLAETEAKRLEDYKRILEAAGYRVIKI